MSQCSRSAVANANEIAPGKRIQNRPCRPSRAYRLPSGRTAFLGQRP